MREDERSVNISVHPAQGITGSERIIHAKCEDAGDQFRWKSLDWITKWVPTCRVG
jgi:hypothetical protein